MRSKTGNRLSNYKEPRPTDRTLLYKIDLQFAKKKIIRCRVVRIDLKTINSQKLFESKFQNEFREEG
jgi:hypothetical protein